MRVAPFLFVLLALGLATADATLMRGALIEPQEEGAPTIEEHPPIAEQTDAPGVARRSGPDVDEVLRTKDIAIELTEEASILRQVIPGETPVTTFILLQNNDRIGLLSWTESPSVKLYYMALKEALHTAFTTQLTDLIDETQIRDGKPVRNFLSFLDTGISEERIVFARVRERLYEMHIAKDREIVMFDLLESLSL
ncbi:MAG: hypothetical protein Q7R81_03975 [Candidatus Peregrinibacteria bacterium]|nr:hypothetical protein [Candidatus Peregrinibacteria bacterium]